MFSSVINLSLQFLFHKFVSQRMGRLITIEKLFQCQKNICEKLCVYYSSKPVPESKKFEWYD